MTEAAYTPIYKAMMSMRVKFPDGKYRDVQPGEPVPGAEKWNNPALWLKRGFIARIDGKVDEPCNRGPYVPPRSLTPEDLEEQLASPERRPSPFPAAGPATIGPSQGTPAAVTDPTEREFGEVAQEVPPEIDAKAFKDLKARTRAELIKIAESMDVKVNDSDSKADIARSLLTR